MTILLPAQLHRDIITHAEYSYPCEACGLLTGFMPTQETIMLTSYTASKNIAENPASTFQIDPATHIQLQKTSRLAGQSIVGICHSHPEGDAVLSALDKKNACPTIFFWMVLAIRHTKVVAYRCYNTLPVDNQFTEVTVHIINP